jgi:TrmH family RNA methyltransferase
MDATGSNNASSNIDAMGGNNASSKMDAPGSKRMPSNMGALSNKCAPSNIDALSNEDYFRRYIILDGVSDPGNVGSIIRTAEAAGFRGLIMSPGCADAHSSKTLRASMGSALRFPVVCNANLLESIRALKDFGILVLAAASDARKCYFDYDLSGSVAFVIGNEAFGVSEEVLSACDGSLRLPMPGNVESLNAGVAAGILIYEALRQNAAKEEYKEKGGII